MRPLTDKLFSTYRVLGGGAVRGLLSEVPSTGTEPTHFRTLLVRKPSPVKIGNVLFGPGGNGLLLLEHPSDFWWAVTFKVLFISRKVSWKRPVKVIDPVSKMKKDNGYQDMGLLYLNFDTGKKINGDLDAVKYQFYTGQDVRVDDVVGGRNVKRIVDSYGVKLVEAI